MIESKAAISAEGFVPLSLDLSFSTGTALCPLIPSEIHERAVTAVSIARATSHPIEIPLEGGEKITVFPSGVIMPNGNAAKNPSEDLIRIVKSIRRNKEYQTNRDHACIYWDEEVAQRMGFRESYEVMMDDWFKTAEADHLNAQIATINVRMYEAGARLVNAVSAERDNSYGHSKREFEEIWNCLKNPYCFDRMMKNPFSSRQEESFAPLIEESTDVELLLKNYQIATQKWFSLDDRICTLYSITNPPNPFVLQKVAEYLKSKERSWDTVQAMKGLDHAPTFEELSLSLFENKLQIAVIYSKDELSIKGVCTIQPSSACFNQEALKVLGFYLAAGGGKRDGVIYLDTYGANRSQQELDCMALDVAYEFNQRTFLGYCRDPNTPGGNTAMVAHRRLKSAWLPTSIGFEYKIPEASCPLTAHILNRQVFNPGWSILS